MTHIGARSIPSTFCSRTHEEFPRPVGACRARMTWSWSASAMRLVKPTVRRVAKERAYGVRGLLTATSENGTALALVDPDTEH